MIEVKCIGGECHGLSVKIEPQPTYYEVVDPRDRTRRDFYILEVGPQGARLVPEETAEWRGGFLEQGHAGKRGGLRKKKNRARGPWAKRPPRFFFFSVPLSPPPPPFN